MEAQVVTRKISGQNLNTLTPHDKGLLKEIYAVLNKHNAEKRFGLTLVQEDFQITADEVLIESTDMSKRTQTIKPYKISEVEHLDAIDTSWRLDTGTPLMGCKCVVGGPEGGHNHYSRG